MRKGFPKKKKAKWHKQRGKVQGMAKRCYPVMGKHSKRRRRKVRTMLNKRWRASNRCSKAH